MTVVAWPPRPSKRGILRTTGGPPRVHGQLIQGRVCVYVGLCTMPESSKKLLTSTMRVQRCSSECTRVVCDSVVFFLSNVFFLQGAQQVAPLASAQLVWHREAGQHLQLVNEQSGWRAPQQAHVQHHSEAHCGGATDEHLACQGQGLLKGFHYSLPLTFISSKKQSFCLTLKPF